MTQLDLGASFLSKKFVLTTLAYLILVVSVFIFLVHPARYNIWLLIISQFLLYFLALFYFIPVIKTRKKGAVYCVLIPFFCCMTTYTTHDFITRLVDGRLSYYLKLKHYESINGIVGIMAHFGLAPYLFLWIITIPLLITYCFYLYLSRHAEHYPEKKEVLPPCPLQEAAFKVRLFQHKGVTFAALIVYSIYAIFHYCLLKWQWKAGSEVFFSAISVCLLSFLSFFYLAPVVVGKVVKSIICCIILPFFWSTIIHVVYAIPISFYLLFDGRNKDNLYISIGKSTFIFEKSIFSIKFYLTGYIATHAWFISVSLLLMCGIYYYFAKSECSIKTSNMRV